jgi:hypothetical protein
MTEWVRELPPIYKAGISPGVELATAVVPRVAPSVWRRRRIEWPSGLWNTGREGRGQHGQAARSPHLRH